MVRMSVKELEESQKILMTIKLREAEKQRTSTSTVGGSLLIPSDNKIDLWEAKTEVYELLRPMKGESYRTRCLHHNGGFKELKSEIEIPLTILVPHYEVNFFKER